MRDYLNLLDAPTFFILGCVVSLITLNLSVIGANHLLNNKDDPTREDYKHPLVFIAAVLFIFVTCSIVAFLGGYLYLDFFNFLRTGETSILLWIVAIIICIYFVYALIALLIGFSDVLHKKFHRDHLIIKLYALLVCGFLGSYIGAPLFFFMSLLFTNHDSLFFNEEFWFRVMFFPFNL